MLPEIKESFTHSFDGKELADHFGAKPPYQTPDIPTGGSVREARGSEKYMPDAGVVWVPLGRITGYSDRYPAPGHPGC
jgi:hypothetical protein